jgi:hypothetical protein
MAGHWPSECRSHRVIPRYEEPKSRKTPPSPLGVKVHPIITHADGRSEISTLPVTEEKLMLHAKRYGLGAIAEVAKWEGITLSKGGPDKDITVRTRRLKRRRRTDASLRRDVLERHGRGRMVAAIADVLNVSDRRVKEILASAEAA